MAHHYRPGMKMYLVVWERDGEPMLRYALHAADETDARLRAEASLAELADIQKFDFDRAGTTVRVDVITSSLNLNDDY